MRSPVASSTRPTSRGGSRRRSRGDPWPLYRRLRAGNPAPFGAFLDLGCTDDGPRAILSASPEAFLAVDAAGRRHDGPDQGHASARPRPRRRPPTRVRAPRQCQGPRRERDDRGRAAQRPRPRRGARAPCGCRGCAASSGPAPSSTWCRASRRSCAPASDPFDAAHGGVPWRLDHRRAEDPRDGAAGRPGTRRPRPVHRHARAGSGPTARCAPASSSAHSSRTGAGSRCTSAAASPGAATRPTSGTRPSPRRAGRCGRSAPSRS